MLLSLIEASLARDWKKGRKEKEEEESLNLHFREMFYENFIKFLKIKRYKLIRREDKKKENAILGVVANFFYEFSNFQTFVEIFNEFVLYFTISLKKIKGIKHREIEVRRSFREFFTSC